MWGEEKGEKMVGAVWCGGVVGGCGLVVAWWVGAVDLVVGACAVRSGGGDTFVVDPSSMCGGRWRTNI
jgi:hypothetical protein